MEGVESLVNLLIGAAAAWMLVMCSCKEIDERGPRNSLPQWGQRDTLRFGESAENIINQLFIRKKKL